MTILKNKLGTFWLAIILASICNLFMATIKGMDIMINMDISPRAVLIVTALLLAYAYFRLCIKKDTDCSVKSFCSFKSHRMQKLMLWINALLTFSIFFGCNIGLPW
jgi:ABC-type long-subunit fatty acid transport system fused permease/ATPase subunit